MRISSVHLRNIVIKNPQASKKKKGGRKLKSLERIEKKGNSF